MYSIIDGRGTGKTSRLMLIAKENDATFVCMHPDKMREKAYAYGITGINFISYREAAEPGRKGKIVIDDMDRFINYVTFPCEVIGYTLSDKE